MGSWIPDGAGGRATVFGIPFEGLLDIHRQLFPGSDKVARFLTDNLTGSAANPAHELLAAGILASPPVFPRVVTLTYDELIEEARPGADWQSVRVTTEEECRAWRTTGARSLLFKLHGSFHSPETIVATLSTEHGLPRWKTDLLREIVAGNVLVMVGYSGYDFDVCPVLLESGPRHVYWNTREPDHEFPEDAQLLLDRGGRHISGDVTDPFEAIRNNSPSSPCLPAVTRGVGAPRATQGMSFSEEEALGWLVRVVVEVGVGDLALKLIDGRRNL